ncbi:MAG: DUF294 nucleotidyltransferase-like domain-containing protein [Pseudomonadota bacterium]
MALEPIHKADPEAVLAFLKRTAPFSELPDRILRKLSGQCAIDFFPKGALVLKQDVTEVKNLYLISKGAVKVYLAAEDDQVVSLMDFRGEGGHFGALSIIRGSQASFNVETVEDTFCFLIDKETFLELIKTHPAIAQYYLKRFSEDVVSTVYMELRDHQFRAQGEDAFYLFGSRLIDVVKRSPEIIDAGESIQIAATRMAERGIGSILVRDPSGEVVGIVTDKDLRSRVVAKGLGYGVPVGEIMTSPVKTISAHSVCFDALLQMMSEHLHHLVVERQNEILGVVTAHDIMVHQGTSPLSLFREIVGQNELSGLYPLSKKIPSVVRTLISGGAKANNITRVITVLNDHIVHRVLGLLEEELGPPPHPFCWMTLGSEGRKEQTFKTDQDNALVYDTPPDNWDQVKEAKLYFRRFGNLAAEQLAACGFPLCKGKMMASNPVWRKPFTVWRGYFDRWMSAPEPQGVLHATIFFDFRSTYGQLELGEKLRGFLNLEAPRRGIFLMHLAKDCISNRPPLSLFRNFVVEKDGRYKNRIDLKTRGMVPFVDFARVLALKHGLSETNTLARMRELGDVDLIPHDIYAECMDAYEFQMQLRLVHQLRLIEDGRQPDNYIDPTELSDLEKQTLKEAFAVIGRLQGFAKEHFHVLE